MTREDCEQLSKGDSVEYHDGRQWLAVEVLEPLRDAGSYKGATVRVTNGTYETEAAPKELRA